MLDKPQLTELFDHLGTPRAGRDLVLSAQNEAPVREVKSNGGNVVTVLQSRKMDRSIKTESRHVEFAAAVDKEFDAAVLEYYPQPCKLTLTLVDEATGETHAITHFPDFLVIRADGITLEEWKPAGRMARLAERYPYRYQRGSDGRWYAPQIAKQLADMGIRYEVHTDTDIPQRRIENYLHLADYFDDYTEPCPPRELMRLQSALAEHGSLYLHELFAEPYLFKADHVLKAIADQQVCADLDRDILSKPREARVYRDITLREFLASDIQSSRLPQFDAFMFTIAPGCVFAFESQNLTIQLVGEQAVICTHDDGRQIALTREWMAQAHEKGQLAVVSAPDAVQPLYLANYSQAELDAALRRDVILHSKQNTQVCDRTTRRWQARQTEAQLCGGHEILALVPKTKARGNHSARLTEEQERILSDIIDTHWRTTNACNYKSCHRHLMVACDEAGIPAPSYPTLIARIKHAETDRDLRTRHGKRMAYQMGGFVDALYHDTPVHGSRPFQYVHIDHTQLDIELIDSRTGKPLGKPWLSIAIDAWSRRIVAIYLSFDAPSYQSTMMVIRDMVRRHGRLPEFLVLDNGADFRSTALDSFLSVMNVHPRFRPSGNPRHGAVMERIFGRVNTEYVHNLSGNTKATKNVRMVSGKHLPKNFAEWTLESMYYGLEHWAFEYYEQEVHPALDCTPREAFMRGLQACGSRPQRQILFNRDFLIATCPPVDRAGVRRIDKQRGVKVNELLYWAPEFRDPRIAGQSVPVRHDPWDAASVYVWINDHWVQATCRNLAGLRQLTDKERATLTEEYLQRGGVPLHDDRTKQRLREFIQVFTPEGAMAAAMARQNENKTLYNNLQLTNVAPIAPMQQFRLDEDISDAESNPASRSVSLSHVLPPPEAPLADALPDFDTF